MKRIRFLAAVLTVIAVLSSLSSSVGCANSFSEIKYNAKMYDHCNDWINPDFLESNKISGAFYPDPEYDENNPDHPNKYYQEKSDIKTRTFVINDKETFEQIFLPNTLSVDFENETAILYIFSEVHGYLDCYISDVSVEGEKATIYFKYEFSEGNGATMPYARCLVVTMEKTNISTVEFIKKS